MHFRAAFIMVILATTAMSFGPARAAMQCHRTLSRITSNPADSARCNFSSHDHGIAQAVDEALCQGLIGSATVLIGTSSEVLFERGYNADPEKVYDLASVTKPLATATAIMLLQEETPPKLKLDDPIGKYLPEFRNSRVTVRELLNHTSGLRDISYDNPTWSNPEGLQRYLGHKFGGGTPLNKTYKYQDVNYFLASRIVQKVSGKPLDRFAEERIFKPLQLSRKTFFANRRNPLRPLVKDPLARSVGGVGGNAGMFSNAQDLKKYARMLLREGAAPEGKPFLKPSSIRLMSEATSTKVDHGLGFDGNPTQIRPDDASLRTFGHTGSTGTMILIDPDNDLFVIVLADRINSGSINPLRKEIATHALRMRRSPTRGLAGDCEQSSNASTKRGTPDESRPSDDTKLFDWSALKGN